MHWKPTQWLQHAAELALFLGCGLEPCSAGARGLSAVPVADGVHPLRLERVLENTDSVPQTVVQARVSCRCLSVDLQPGRVLAPGEKAAFAVTYQSSGGGDGLVCENVVVTLVPSGRTVVFPVEVEVRHRLYLDPPEIAFGAIHPGTRPPERKTVLAGMLADAVTLGTPVPSEGRPVFDVHLGGDGRSLCIRYPENPPVAGILAETWKIPTDDEAVTELLLVITASVEGPLVTVPAAVVLSADETDGARRIRLRRRDGEDFSVRAAAIRPEACGIATTVRRIASGSWEVALAGINALVLRAASMPAWLEIDTDVPGGAQLRIPLRVDETEGVKP